MGDKWEREKLKEMHEDLKTHMTDSKAFHADIGKRVNTLEIFNGRLKGIGTVLSFLGLAGLATLFKK